jgi:hypothetical protein
MQNGEKGESGSTDASPINKRKYLRDRKVEDR